MLPFRAFLTEATVHVNGQTIPVVKPRRAGGDVLVDVLVEPFDRVFARDKGFYIGHDGTGGIGDRYARFGTWITTATSIDAPEVSIDSDGGIGFTNGRHRYAWLRDHGVTRIPMAMSRASARNAKQSGYL